MPKMNEITGMILMHRYIVTGEEITRQGLSKKIGVSKKVIDRYFYGLREFFNVEIYKGNENYTDEECLTDEEDDDIQNNEKRGDGKYKIEKSGDLENIRAANAITPEQALLLIFIMNQSKYFISESKEIEKKIIKLLPKKERAHLQKLITVNSFEASDSYEYVYEHFKKIRSAMIEKKEIDVSYLENERLVVQSEVVPIKFYSMYNRIFLLALGNLHFDLINMKDIKITEKTFELEPINYSCETEKLLNTWYGYQGNMVRVRFILHKNGYDLMELRRKNIEMEIVEQNKEFRIMEVDTYGLDGIKTWLMGFGSNVEVLSPEELKRDIEDEFHKIVEMYSYGG